jgi:transposase
MPKAYSEDLRSRVIDAATEGAMSVRQAARQFKVSASAAIKWVQCKAKTGRTAPEPSGGDRRSHVIGEHERWLLNLIEAEPDLTLIEVKRRLLDERQFKAGLTTVWRFFKRNGISLKKKPSRLGAGPPGRR